MHETDEGRQGGTRPGRQRAFVLGSLMSSRLRAWEKKPGVSNLLQAVGGHIRPFPPVMERVREYLNSLEDLPDGAAEEVSVEKMILILG